MGFKWLWVLVVLATAGAALAADCSGIYVLSQGDVTITLTLRQAPDGTVAGTMEGSNGTTFQINGAVEEGVVSGACMGAGGMVGFEAEPKGDSLTFSMIELGPGGMPDESQIKRLLFTRQGAKAAKAGKAAKASKAVKAVVKPSPATEPSAPAEPETPAAGAAGAGGQRLSDPMWGFSFAVPAGWKGAKTQGGGAVVGSDTIPGAVLVLPHQEQGAEAVKARMRQGLTEEGVELRPAGALTPLGSSAVAGLYSGSLNGQPAKARGIGAWGPGGGGAYVLGVTVADKYGKELQAAADAVASSIRYEKAEGGDLARHFVGTWSTMNNYGTSTMTLYADGTYSDSSESVHSGRFSNQYGDVTGNWGTGSQSQGRGRWSVRGDQRQGQLTFTDQTGTGVKDYRVHVEGGQVYWNEYKIAGRHWSRSR